jgi:hypothetical protein
MNISVSRPGGLGLKKKCLMYIPAALLQLYGHVKEFLLDDSALSIFRLYTQFNFRDNVGYFEN